MSIANYTKIYRENLLNDVVPFWMKNSLDEKFGGFFTCLDTNGKVYDTDKFIWLQCRQVWCFSMLYNRVEKKQEWLDIAIHGAEFLIKNGRDAEGNWYFSLNQKGVPLTQPFNIFSDCFASMAFGQLFQATNKKEYGDIAVTTFHNILRRQKDPKGKYSKAFPDTRPLKSFALPMILCNLVLEIEHLLDPALVESTIANGIKAVMTDFYQPESGLILENISVDGSFSDSFEGRLLNPGHGLESMWFMMDLAKRVNDKILLQKAVDTTINIRI